MALTEISVTLLLLVGIMSATFGTSDQTSELEKANVNGDAQDVSMAVERSNRPIELEEEDKYGDVQHFTCFYKYHRCIHRFSHHCSRVCLFQYHVCKRHPRSQDAEGSIQDSLVAPSQPAEFEEESEN